MKGVYRDDATCIRLAVYTVPHARAATPPGNRTATCRGRRQALELMAATVFPAICAYTYKGAGPISFCVLERTKS